MTDYSVRLYTATGQLIAEIDDFVRLEYARSVNDPGSLSLDLPYTFASRFTSDPFAQPDAILAVMRTVAGGSPAVDLATQWFVRYSAKIVNQRRKVQQVQALGALHLL